MATRPGEPSPRDTPVQIRFPIAVRDHIEKAPLPLWLHAAVYWGPPPKSDSDRATLEHVYGRRQGSSF